MRSSLTGYSWLVVVLGLQASQHTRIPEVVTEPWVELRLTVDRPVIDRSIFDEQEEDPGFRLTIRNLGPTPLWLLDPEKGGGSGWRNPSVRWYRADATLVNPEVMCCMAMRIDARGYFALAPGASHEITVRMPLEPGENRLRAVYDISADCEDTDPFGRPLSDESLPPQNPEDPGLRLYRALTPIHATSNLVSVRVRTKPLPPEFDPPSRR